MNNTNYRVLLTTPATTTNQNIRGATGGGPTTDILREGDDLQDMIAFAERLVAFHAKRQTGAKTVIVDATDAVIWG